MTNHTPGRLRQSADQCVQPSAASNVNSMSAPLCIRTVPDGIEIAVKVVPNASRDRIVGPLGDALKIQVAAPPERGKANEAVAKLLAEALGLSAKSVTLTSGPTSPRKVFLARGVSEAEARERLGLTSE
jgi:hypothetical protein